MAYSPTWPHPPSMSPSVPLIGDPVEIVDAKDAVFLDGGNMHSRLDFLDARLRSRAVILFLTGSILGLCGFLFAAFLGFHKFFFEGGRNLYGQPFGRHNYFPQTVSEMVRDPNTPAGKCFFAFMLTGAFCMLMSWYPMELRNVYVGDDRMLCCLGGPTCITMRNILPPIGMLIVACIPTTPAMQAGFRDEVTVQIHTLGAVLMIGTYIGFEAYALGSPNIRLHGRREKALRSATLLICIIGGVGFLLLGQMIVNNDPDPDSCWDKWLMPNSTINNYAMDNHKLGTWVENAEKGEDGKMRVFQVAEHGCLAIKVWNYICECLAGLGMIFNMLAIWYFCPERHLHFTRTELQSVAGVVVSDSDALSE
eukprot:TRINITY_DN87283_c0_g1_i1.p1 TRINITY_DN87283_c0_g1~~TRINITY_DN87283_c0_g1_i1.p1  ORF type:complete len:365 (+),score=37.04 TRINITY_DN87283_c0_g1_i1:37-1131(+)